MKQKSLLLVLISMLLLGACAPAATPVPVTLPPQPTAAPATTTPAPEPTTPPEPTALPSSSFQPEISPAMEIPSGVATGFNMVTVPAETEFHPHPEYQSIAFDGYAIANVTDTWSQPRVDIFPVDAFIQAMPSASKIIFDLKTLDSSQELVAGQRLPFLSTDIEAQFFTAKPKFLSFANVSGIRYLTQYTQGIYPVMNSRLIYTFQGVTSDGKYYVSAILPEGAAFLPDNFDYNNQNAGLPEGAIAFPSLDSADFATEIKAYRDAITTKIDQTPDRDFSIPLTALDEMVQSLVLQAP